MKKFLVTQILRFADENPAEETRNTLLTHTRNTSTSCFASALGMGMPNELLQVPNDFGTRKRANHHQGARTAITKVALRVSPSKCRRG